MKTEYWTGALACVLFAVTGCSPLTDRTINLADRDLVLGTPIQVQPPGSSVIAFSPDGRLYVVQTPPDDPIQFEVRDYSGRTLYRAQAATTYDDMPLMFVRNGTSLVCYRARHDENGPSEQLVLLSWQSGRTDVLPIDTSQPSSSSDDESGSDSQLWPIVNVEQDMLVVGSNLVLPNGAVVSLPKGAKPAGWGKDGSLVAEQGKGWLVVGRDGKPQSQTSAPPLRSTETMEKGTLSLATVSNDLTYEGSRASVSGLWLSDSSTKADDKHKSAAFVVAGYDMGGSLFSFTSPFGFVPGHNAVYFRTNESTYVVEFTDKPVEKSQG